MMRRLAYLLTGAIFGGGLVAFALQGNSIGTISAVAASSETYRQLNLFGDVFEKIRTDYVEKPDDIRPALERAKLALARGQSALVNVVTDWKARADMANFARHMT